MVDRVRNLSAALMVGFMVIAGALGYWQVFGAENVLQRPTNPRQIEEERRIIRGRILDRNGEVLASSQRVGELAQRSYMYAPLATVIGYASTQHGKSGIEDTFDAFLKGDRAADPVAEIRNKVLPAERRGSDVRLTIDLRLQKAADEALGNRAGAVAAVNTRTGEVLALASHPYFDANSLDDDWAQLESNPGTPFVNRATQGAYVPGSVFKVVTAAAALDLGIANLGMPHRHQGDLVVEGLKIRNTNHPQLNDREISFPDEFAWSCNVVFGYTGLSLGQSGLMDLNVLAPSGDIAWRGGDISRSEARLREYTGKFGIGQRVPFDLPVSAGLISRTEKMSAAQLASTAFGQGDLQVSPLQMAMVVATVANGGVMPAPYLVSAVEDRTGTVLKEPRTGAARRVISPQAAAELNAMMQLSVDTAYARPAQITGVRVGGKTGTAEVGTAENPHSWFVGYAPADRSGVAVAVILENLGSGTTYATPVGQQVLKAALDLGY
jgi:penicillin-binding protein A